MKPPRAPYKSPLRARLKEQTSIIILEAVAKILREADLNAVSIAEVARVARMSEQTIYRHYNSRDALMRAFTEYYLDHETGGPQRKLPETIAELLEWVSSRYRAWENDHRIVSEIYLAPVGRELREPLYAIGYTNIMRMLERERPNLGVDARSDIAAAMLTLMSTENFVFLHRTLGFGAKQVHTSVKAAIDAILAGTE
ncbi:TetR/AcrR family transcriptional regulator [Aquisediminimonas profunda]|uniref:TetR/AcrR family transcriptional regulator n=1 Tax=Aquisediminimonas profunda TaxID=1550733 RepID=UPI001C63B383|nr:TetR/AcrR family transcriptional regulator [Aquisediminimonas profunda]